MGNKSELSELSEISEMCDAEYKLIGELILGINKLNGSLGEVADSLQDVRASVSRMCRMCTSVENEIQD